MTAVNYKECVRCVMDTSDVDIVFDENGICNHCTNFYNRTIPLSYKQNISEKALEKLIEKIKKTGKNNKYDCIIGVSGGIDSSYVAYLSKEFGLRALLVHIDNGWDSEVSVRNIKNLADKLGFDYESYVLDWQEFKNIQLAFLKASIPEMETPTDIAIPAALHKVATKYNVKYIISGGNFATEAILPKTWHYDAKDLKYLKHILKKFGNVKIKKFPLFGWKNEIWFKFIKGIKIVYFLNMVPFKKDDAIKILEQKLGWKYYGGKHRESKYTSFVQTYIMPVKFNMDYRRATFSTQICNNEITRDFALMELKKLPYNTETLMHETEYVCKKLDISLKNFEDIMKQPPKIYRDYPNSEVMLETIYTIYRKLFQKKEYK